MEVLKNLKNNATNCPTRIIFHSIFVVLILSFCSCSSPEEEQIPTLYDEAPNDFRLVTTGFVDTQGDTINTRIWEYDSFGRYIDYRIVYDDQGRMIQSERPLRPYVADYFYGNDNLLDSVYTGSSYFGYENRDKSIYLIVGRATHDSQSRMTEFRFTQRYRPFSVLPSGNGDLDWKVQFSYSENEIAISQYYGVDRYIFGEEKNPFPEGYRKSLYWEGIGTDWFAYISDRLPKRKIEVLNDTIIEYDFDKYTFNSYGYPTRFDKEDGHSFYIYNYD